MVKKLSEQLAGGNYHIYFDNFFSSVKLFEDLLEDGIYACGTFRSNRVGIPKAIQDTKLGEFQCSVGVEGEGDILGTSYKQYFSSVQKTNTAFCTIHTQTHIYCKYL